MHSNGTLPLDMPLDARCGYALIDRDFQWKKYIPKFGSIFNLNMLSVILVGSYCKVICLNTHTTIYT